MRTVSTGAQCGGDKNVYAGELRGGPGPAPTDWRGGAAGQAVRRWSWYAPSSHSTGEGSTQGHHQMVNTKITLIIFFAAKDGEALHHQQKQDQELTVAQIINSLLQNSDLN